MQLQGVRPGDIVFCDVKGRRFYAEVQEKEGRELRILPLHSNITYFHVSARQVVRHYRLSGRNGAKIPA